MESKETTQDAVAEPAVTREGASEVTDSPVAPAGREYRYARFTTSLLLRDLRFQSGVAGPGDSFPVFRLVTTDDEELTNRDLFGNNPVLFVFGSITCPMTASAMPFLKQMYKEFGERVDLVMVNVREAHLGEHLGQPATLAEKLDHAKALKQLYSIPWTVACDDIEGTLHRALDPKPNAAILVNGDGTILFRSLWSSDQTAMRNALASAIAGRAPDKRQSQLMFVPVVRAMGHVQEVMERAGPMAVRDLWLSGLPMALAGRVATLFKSLSPDQRGVAAVVSLAVALLLIPGLVAVWLLG